MTEVVERQITGGRFRLFAVLAGLYLAQGIPSYLFAAAIPPIMRELGVSKSAISLIALLFIPLILKFFWAPLVDRRRLLPFGHRRGWILPTQTVIVALIAALAFVDPREFWPVLAIGFVMAIAISTQDIATDGYATRSLAPEDRGIGNAIQAGSVALGVIVGGTTSLILYESLGWQRTMLIIAALSLLPLLAIAFMREDTDGDGASTRAHRPSLAAFLKRPETLSILTLALVYRASEGLVKAMEGPYLVDIGVSLSTVGWLSGLSAATAGLAGAAVAAVLIRYRGSRATLLLLSSLRTVCFLIFAVHAFDLVPGTTPVMGAAVFQTLIRYMELVALYSVFMAAASREQPGTDFTTLFCAQLVVYFAGSLVAGSIADLLGYGWLFLIATSISAAAVIATARLLRQAGST